MSKMFDLQILKKHFFLLIEFKKKFLLASGELCLAGQGSMICPLSAKSIWLRGLGQNYPN